MSNETVDIDGVQIPNDFAADQYQNVVTKFNDGISRLRIAGGSEFFHPADFVTIWRAVPWRFRTCCEHSDTFSNSISTDLRSITAEERFFQDQELFGFVYAGHSALETAYYGVHFLAAVRYRQDFPINKAEDLRILSERIVKRFERWNPNDQITQTLIEVRGSDDYKDWGELRNVLTHRSTHRRLHHIGGDKAGYTEIPLPSGLRVELNSETTVKKRQWLVGRLNQLVAAADSFIDRHYI